jgi:hypothetical protein
MITGKLSAGEDKPFTCNVFDWSVGLLKVTEADLPILIRFKLLPVVPVRWPTISKVFIARLEPTGGLRWREYVEPLKQLPGQYPMK